MLAELRGHIPRLAEAVAEAQAGGSPSYDWTTTGAAETVKRKAKTTPPPADQEDAAADLRLRQADRQRRRRQADRVHAGPAERRRRLRARQPQARDGDRARAEPAGGRAVQRLRRPHRPRRRPAADGRRRAHRAPGARVRGAPPPPRRGPRGRAAPAQRGVVMSVLEVPTSPEIPTTPAVPDAPVQPAVPEPGPVVPDTPDGPEPPEPDDPLPPDPDGPSVPGAGRGLAAPLAADTGFTLRRHLPARAPVRRDRRLRGGRRDVARARAGVLGLADLPRARGARRARDPAARRRLARPARRREADRARRRGGADLRAVLVRAEARPPAALARVGLGRAAAGDRDAADDGGRRAVRLRR